MKKISVLIMLLTFTQCVIAGPSGILASAKPKNGEKIIKKLLDIKHTSKLYSYVWIVKDGKGRILLKILHSNGTRGDQNIQFVVACNQRETQEKTIQYLGHSYHGAVERAQYFTIDCPANNIGVRFVANEVWNSIDLTLKVIAGVYGTYTW